MNYPRLSVAGLFLLTLTPAFAITLPHIISDHMVLQRGKPVPIWGWAKQGEAITVTFAGQKKQTTVAGADGRWEVWLDPLAASAEPAEMTVAGTETITVKDVLVGEVWLCSGQSNMEKPLADELVPQPPVNGQPPPPSSGPELKDVTFPDIRLLKVNRDRKPVVLTDANVAWTGCTRDSLISTRFSAAGFYFARKIHNELKVPVGIIESSFGGSPIEPWIPKEAFKLAPSLSDYAAAAQLPWQKGTPQFAMMYNSMIAPLVPYAIRGVLWYQGESNVLTVDVVERYSDEMFALIEGWRAAWHDDFPFYYVQIAPYTYFREGGKGYADSPDREALFWEKQTDALQIPHTGMIVTTDITDDPHNHHPRDKKSVGERLASWALAKDYGRGDLVYSGPMFKKMEVQGNRALLEFDFASGLKSKDGKPLTWFAVAGNDGKFVPANAVIEGNHVVVSSPTVSSPTVVRFAWDQLALPNLCNGAGLPAAPFRTDPEPWKMPSLPPIKDVHQGN
jgi:sialate O-acetylesterase